MSRRASWNVCESRISVISGPNRLQAKRTCGIHCRARESSVGDGRSGHFLLTGHDPGSQYPMWSPRDEWHWTPECQTRAGTGTALGTPVLLGFWH